MRTTVLLLFVAVAAASCAAQGLAPAKLQAMEQVISSGEFKKIGSVVVAQRGNVVYEHYFEGDAATLRDTRSATKSITDYNTCGMHEQTEKLLTDYILAAAEK